MDDIFHRDRKTPEWKLIGIFHGERLNWNMNK